MTRNKLTELGAKSGFRVQPMWCDVMRTEINFTIVDVSVRSLHCFLWSMSVFICVSVFMSQRNCVSRGASDTTILVYQKHWSSSRTVQQFFRSWSCLVTLSCHLPKGSSHIGSSCTRWRSRYVHSRCLPSPPPETCSTSPNVVRLRSTYS